MMRPPMRSRAFLVLLATAGGATALVIALTGSLVAAVVAGLLVLGTALVVIRDRTRDEATPDPSRRRLLLGLGGLGLALVAGGSALGHALKRLARPDPRPRLEADASDLGAEYLELVVRAYHPERSGDLQLLVTPYSTSNYPQESTSLVPNDPRTSHAVVWMYGERVPIVVWAPGLVDAQDRDRARHVGGPGADHRDVDGIRRVPGRRRRHASGHRGPRDAAARDRDVRDRRGRVERARPVARRVAEPEGASCAKVRRTETRSPGPSPPSRRPRTRRSARARSRARTASPATTSAGAAAR